MLAFQNSLQLIPPVRRRGICSAPQARIHMLSRESPRSPGTSRPRPSTSGHVRTTDSPAYARPADTAEKEPRATAGTEGSGFKLALSRLDTVLQKGLE